MIYKVAEKFKSIQGEGVYTGTPMAFIRFVGCSVGKKICQHCDTDFDETMPWRGGGEFSATELGHWTSNHTHVCFTGGEPLDQDLKDLVYAIQACHKARRVKIHIETSGTKQAPDYMLDSLGYPDHSFWICVSPKPGWKESMIRTASEVKVIVPGLGTVQSLDLLRQNSQQIPIDGRSPVHGLALEGTFRWPTLEDALCWVDQGKIVFLQPRNLKNEVDKQNLMYVMDIIRDHPELRLSAQLHKILKVQ